MKEYTRNLAVGLTVIIGLVFLAGMILFFAGLPTALKGGYSLYLHFPAAGDVHKGDRVNLNDIPIGNVTDIAFPDNDPRKGVIITIQVNNDVRVPGDVTPYIFQKEFISGAYLALKPGGPARVDPATGRALDFLPTNWSQPLDGEIRSGLIPEDLKSAIDSLGKLAASLSDLLASPPAASGPASGPASQPAGAMTQASLRATLTNLNKALEGMAAVFGDPENQKNLKTAIANLATATKQATEAMDAVKAFAIAASGTAKEGSDLLKQTTTRVARAGEDIDSLARSLIEDADKVSKLMTSINHVAAKFEAGEGTAGKLFNDPALYNALLDATRQLNDLIKDLRGLSEQWKQQGINLKIK